MNHLEHASSFIVISIASLYAIFSLQVVWQAKWAKFGGAGPKSLLMLAVVFVLCACAGYVTSLMSPDYWAYREALHWVLAGVMLVMVLTNQARHIAKMLESDERD